jgi:hypothetical protein
MALLKDPNAAVGEEVPKFSHSVATLNVVFLYI